MPDDRVRKGQTKLNMFSVLDEQIKSLSSKQSKLNFWNRLNPKFAFLCRLLTQTATWRPNHPILTSSVTAILKAMTDTVFLGPTLGVVRFFLFRLGGFFNKREYSEADCPDLLSLDLLHHIVCYVLGWLFCLAGCQKCDRLFRTWSLLRLHLIIDHDNIFGDFCENCDIWFEKIPL